MEIKNKYGYVRVSFKTQESNSSIESESQKQQLIQNGIKEENIFVEIGSGTGEIKNRSVLLKKQIEINYHEFHFSLKEILLNFPKRLYFIFKMI